MQTKLRFPIWDQLIGESFRTFKHLGIKGKLYLISISITAVMGSYMILSAFKTYQLSNLDHGKFFVNLPEGFDLFVYGGMALTGMLILMLCLYCLITIVLKAYKGLPLTG